MITNQSKRFMLRTTVLGVVSGIYALFFYVVQCHILPLVNDPIIKLTISNFLFLSIFLISILLICLMSIYINDYIKK